MADLLSRNRHAGGRPRRLRMVDGLNTPERDPMTRIRFLAQESNRMACAEALVAALVIMIDCSSSSDALHKKKEEEMGMGGFLIRQLSQPDTQIMHHCTNHNAPRCVAGAMGLDLRVFGNKGTFAAVPRVSPSVEGHIADNRTTTR